MPTFYRDDDKPVVQFDPRLEVSPFTLFRRLREGHAPLLVDIRDEKTGRSLRDAVPWEGEAWRPPAEADVVLFDEDGSEAVAVAARLQEDGFGRVKALFGGLELYEFSLDPQVVGEETHLIRIT